MNRRQFLLRASAVAAGVVAADQIELLDRLGWRRRFFPSAHVGLRPDAFNGVRYHMDVESARPGQFRVVNVTEAPKWANGEVFFSSREVFERFAENVLKEQKEGFIRWRNYGP